jgi:hypothetical protein
MLDHTAEQTAGHRLGRGRGTARRDRLLVVGIEGQLACASVGIAIGLLCSRLVIRRQGFALVTALALVIVALLAPGMVPVNVLVRRMSEGSTSAALFAPVSGLVAIAVVILAAGAIATQFIATRRD